MQRRSPLACAVGHVAVFAVNAALVASQWQHRAGTVDLRRASPLACNRPPGWGQVARSMFEVFGMTLPGIAPNLPATMAHAKPSTPLTVRLSWSLTYLKTTNTMCKRGSRHEVLKVLSTFLPHKPKFFLFLPNKNHK